MREIRSSSNTGKGVAVKADQQNKCADDDVLYGAFCADLRDGFAGKTAPADVVERMTRRVSLKEETATAFNAAAGKRAGRKSAFVVTAVGVAACLAFADLLRAASVAVSKCRCGGERMPLHSSRCYGVYWILPGRRLGARPV